MTFTRPAMDEDETFDHAVRFAVIKREAAVMPVLGGPGSHVVTVDDTGPDTWDEVAQSAATSILSGVPGVPSVAMQGARARSAMRGEGRPRFR